MGIKIYRESIRYVKITPIDPVYHTRKEEFLKPSFHREYHFIEEDKESRPLAKEGLGQIIDVKA